MAVLLTSGELSATIAELAKTLSERHPDFADVVFVGIQQGGAVLGEELVAELQKIHPGRTIPYGQLDITFYRDDIRNELHIPRETNLLQSIEGKKVILIDDVLYTGRTIRAALDALQDFGRPQKVALCVLINRRFSRELPIQPDFCGMAIDTNPGQKVKVEWEREEVILY